MTQSQICNLVSEVFVMSVVGLSCLAFLTTFANEPPQLSMQAEHSLQILLDPKTHPRRQITAAYEITSRKEVDAVVHRLLEQLCTLDESDGVYIVRALTHFPSQSVFSRLRDLRQAHSAEFSSAFKMLLDQTIGYLSQRLTGNLDADAFNRLIQRR